MTHVYAQVASDREGVTTYRKMIDERRGNFQRCFAVFKETNQVCVPLQSRLDRLSNGVQRLEQEIFSKRTHFREHEASVSVLEERETRLNAGALKLQQNEADSNKALQSINDCRHTLYRLAGHTGDIKVHPDVERLVALFCRTTAKI